MSGSVTGQAVEQMAEAVDTAERTGILEAPLPSRTRSGARFDGTFATSRSGGIRELPSPRRRTARQAHIGVAAPGGGS